MVIQRVIEAKVSVAGEITGKIGTGLLVLLAVAPCDDEADADYLSAKVATLRIFADHKERMNRSLWDVKGEALVVPEFTLYADCAKGRRPAFDQAAPPHHAERLYDYFVEKLRSLGLDVATGKFGASMQVSLVNDGPVTFVLNSR